MGLALPWLVPLLLGGPKLKRKMQNQQKKTLRVVSGWERRSAWVGVSKMSSHRLGRQLGR